MAIIVHSVYQITSLITENAGVSSPFESLNGNRINGNALAISRLEREKFYVNRVSFVVLLVGVSDLYINASAKFMAFLGVFLYGSGR